MQPIFIDWSRSFLQTAADYLIQEFTKKNQLDMRHVVLVMSGSRARDRLEEILAEEAEKLADAGKIEPAWYPPEFLTLGTLPEKFYALQKPVANDLIQYLAWIHAIDKMQNENSESLAKVLPYPPERNDLGSRLALGKMFASIHRELAADTLNFATVAEICRQMNIESETQRWEVLAELQETYLRFLDSLNLWDVQTARIFAIQQQKQEEFQRIYQSLQENRTRFILLGLVDMKMAQKKILKKFEGFITPVVFVSKSLAEKFDEFGCLIPDAWDNIEINIDDQSQICLAERPEHQADAVMKRISELNGQFSAEEIVVGVPDHQVIPFLKQRFEQAELHCWQYEGTSVKQTSVYRFLETLLAFLKSPAFAPFAEFVRHPDVERYLYKNSELKGVDFLSMLDNYYTEFLPVEVNGDWREKIDDDNPNDNETFDALKIVWNQLHVLTGQPADAISETASETASGGCRRLKTILKTLYAGPQKQTINDSLKRVYQVIDEVRETPEKLLPKLSFAETIRLVLMQLENDQIPHQREPDSITLLGWLDVVRDDAPVVIVTGMNDGIVPSFLTSDMFLPDGIRQKLKIEDNHLRFARDAYALSAILESRRFAKDQIVYLITGRFSADNDPQLPSRLFFAADNKTTAKRVQKFFTEKSKSQPEIHFKNSVQHAGTSQFKYPTLPPREPAPEAMNVTEFADYVRCPYRYYLKRYYKLKKLDDNTEELDALMFGNLIHEILKQFGRNKAVNISVSAKDIFGFLESALKMYVTKKYGEHPRPVIEIQRERALKRLETFADWQAKWRLEGYEISETEFFFDGASNGKKIFLDVDGTPMFLRGRIDRIDWNESKKHWVVLDYKTSGKAADPEKVRRKNGEWVDFQLPLYRYILQQAGYEEKIVLGYIALPKDTAQTGGKLAQWSSEELEKAIEQAKEIVRCIRNNKFTPPKKLPANFNDEFAAICLG